MSSSPKDEGQVNGAASASRPARRRKSSSLGADPRGDTGTNSIATANLRQASPAARTSEPTQTQHAGKEGGRKRRKARRLLSRWKRQCLKHTWLIPLILILIILALYAISPGAHNPLHHALFLSYADPPLHQRTHTLPAHIGNVTQYGKGRKDFAFVAFYTILLSFTREFLMQRVIRPLAIRAGIRARAKQARFMEQFYTAIYFSIAGPMGLYVMSRTPVWYFNTAGMYDGFPHRAHDAYFKAYYLLQAAYWAQQGLVLLLQLEKPRKDFRELVLHHIITLALIGLSYRFHFTYMGIAVYITHDVSDFFLATSKLLNYLDSPATPPYFVIFVTIWAYLRHYINLRILYSLSPYALPFISMPANQFATVGPFDLNWETQQYKCWISQAITFALLAALQAVNIFWFFLICRILARVVFRGIQKDDRSDDEEEEEEDEEVEEPSSVVQEKRNGSAKGPKTVLNGEPTTPAAAVGGVEGDRKSTLRKR